MKLRSGICAAALTCLLTGTMPGEEVKNHLPQERIRIYQLFVRLFGNTNEARKSNGTIAENGVGKFSHINDAALASLRDMGFSHIWLTGVLQQATATDYSSIGQPADDPDLLKGIAGSPYAIKDYFDVCPDYADKPENRIEEFKSLLDRMHALRLKALIDFVPNHVARSYASDVKPELDFGRNDDTSKQFDPKNNFFYLKPGSGGPPLRLPTVKDGKPVSPTCKLPGIDCDGLFAPEREFGRVTGNNKASWTPGIDDWYETVKLNYGFDFTVASKNVREYPNASAPDKPVPDTWNKMDQVLAYWQSLGVDGFRCDMAHMEPPEFWSWAIARARERNPQVVFIAEAYDNDPAKVPATNSSESNVMFHLLKAGFTGVYDDPTYKALKKIYEGPAWANDLDDNRPNQLIFENSLRYAENHDEVRLASKSQWGGNGMKVGPAISAILYGLSSGPVMLYNGQEVGEPGAGVEGFGSDDSRTSIFDYWSMPELVKWVNGNAYDGGKLSDAQKGLRATYGRLLRLMNEPAFRSGRTIPLNKANNNNPRYGRIGGETASGHWLYSFLRIDDASGQKFLVVVNLHPSETMKDVRITVPADALRDGAAGAVWVDQLAEKGVSATMERQEVRVAEIPPATPLLLRMTL
jgi:glycosidase